MDYLLWKHLHVTCVVLTGLSFALRGLLMAIDSPALQHRVARVLPHVIDTLLLVSAIVLAMTLQQYPFQHGWLTAKVLGLLLYIGLGTIALKRGRTRGIRLTALLGALLTYGWIVGTALTRSPSWGLL